MLSSSRLVKGIIDQIVISIPCINYRTYNLIVQFLEFNYGKCRYIDKKLGEYDWSGYFFEKNKIFFSFIQSRGWCYLVINDNKEVYNKLYRDIVRWRKSGWINNYGNYKAHIHKIELAFDFPTEFRTHEYAVIVLRKLMQHIIPKIDTGKYKDIYIGKELMLCRDGAINGNYTTYWHSVLQKTLKYISPLKTSSSIKDYKTYPKKFYDIWYFRFEVVFYRKELLKKGLYFPVWYSQLERKMTSIKFEELWKYVDVDYRGFINIYKGKISMNHLLPLTKDDRVVLMYDRQPGRIYKMRQLANRMAGSNLPCTWRKKFIRNYTPDEMFDKIDDALTWN